MIKFIIISKAMDTNECTIVQFQLDYQFLD